MDIDLSRIAQSMAGLRVAVIGDAVLDVYLHGRVERLCREAPLPVVEIHERTEVPGGAGNTAVNVQALGGEVRFVSVIGDDQEGRLLQQALSARGVPPEDLVIEGGRRTPAKHRLIGTDQMLARFDQGSRGAIHLGTVTRLLRRIDELFRSVDAVIVSDYGCGLFAPAIVQALQQLQRAAPRVLMLDSRRPGSFAGLQATAVKPSYAEALQLIGARDAGGNRAETVIARSDEILRRAGAQIAAVTLDVDGAVILEHQRPPYRTYARPVHASHSVGGGDTYVSAFTLALAAGAGAPAAAEIAAAAAAVAVGKDATASCSLAELCDQIAGGDKIVPDRRALAALAQIHHGHGRRIVFTNGCFDILHRGHVTLLNRAKGLGDVLIVGVNSDAGVRRLKGPERPINSVEDRIKVLSALSYVDHVIAFDEDSPAALIRAVRPAIYVKGGDYTRETLPEAQVAESLGAAVCILPLVEDRSTSGIIRRIKAAAASA